MKANIDSLAKRHFEIQEAKKQLIIEDNQLKQAAMEEVIRMQAWELVSINWNLVLPPGARKEIVK